MRLNKLIYVSNTRLPTEKAHGLATIKICEAFARCGWQVDLVIPALWRKSGQDIFKYYGAKPNFRIRRIPTLDFFSWGFWGKPAFLLQIFSFSKTAALYAFFKYGRKGTVFFSHDYIPLYFLSFFVKDIFYDIHHFPGRNFMYRRVLKRAFGFAVQTRWKITALKKEFGIPEEKVVYWPNGTDVETFRLNLSRREARQKLSLPQDKKIVLYTGQFFDWKGAATLVQAAPLLKPEALVYLVGGDKTEEQGNIRSVPFQPHKQIPVWLKAADVLVLPNTARQKVSLYYTSPMKLFEYMASGTPIVASAIPSILEIVSGKSAVLAGADNPEDFAEKINWVLDNPAKSGILARQAKRDVGQYTWDNRTRKIIHFFDKNL